MGTGDVHLLVPSGVFHKKCLGTVSTQGSRHGMKTNPPVTLMRPKNFFRCEMPNEEIHCHKSIFV